MPLGPPAVLNGETELVKNIRLHSSLPKVLPQIQVKTETGDRVAMSSTQSEATEASTTASATQVPEMIRGDLIRLSSNLGTAIPYDPSISESAASIGVEGRSSSGGPNAQR